MNRAYLLGAIMCVVFWAFIGVALFWTTLYWAVRVVKFAWDAA